MPDIMDRADVGADFVDEAALPVDHFHIVLEPPHTPKSQRFVQRGLQANQHAAPQQ